MMTLFILLFIFVIGLAVGSFLNVVILRGARSQSLGGRSRCNSCAKTLGMGELIPVISFFIQKRRCRSCRTLLSWQYPIVEAANGILFVLAAGLVFSSLGTGLLAIGYWLLAALSISAGIVIAVSDLRRQIIPNGAVFVLLIVGVGRILSQTKFGAGTDAPNLVWDNAIGDFISALVIALLLASFWFFSRGRWMGFGDAKLIFATSLLIGFPASLAAFLFSFWLGGTAGVLMLAAGAETLKSRIPFGPFILAGTALAYFFSDAFLAFTGLDLLL